MLCMIVEDFNPSLEVRLKYELIPQGSCNKEKGNACGEGFCRAVAGGAGRASHREQESWSQSPKDLDQTQCWLGIPSKVLAPGWQVITGDKGVIFKSDFSK